MIELHYEFKCKSLTAVLEECFGHERAENLYVARGELELELPEVGLDHLQNPTVEIQYITRTRMNDTSIQ